MSRSWCACPVPFEADGHRPGVRFGQRAATLITYLDTPAFMKLVFGEPGSELAAELGDLSEAVISSQSLYPEARAASAAARRLGRVGSDTLEHAVEVIDTLVAQVAIIGTLPWPG